MAGELINYIRIMDRLSAVYPTLPTRAATVAVNFAKERFRSQNWVDTTTEPWKKRKRPKKATRSDRRKVLVKSGRLMRSIRKIRVTKDYAVIGTDVPYARAHNDGLRMQKDVNVRGFNRRSFTRKRNSRTETVDAHTVKPHSRRMRIKLPQRRFLGASAVLDKKIERELTSEILKAIRG